MTNQEYSEKVTNRMIELINSHAILPDDLVKLIEPIKESLRIRTVSEYAKENKSLFIDGKRLTYNGALKRLQKYKSFFISGVKFYITDEPA